MMLLPLPIDISEASAGGFPQHLGAFAIGPRCRPQQETCYVTLLKLLKNIVEHPAEACRAIFGGLG